MYVLVLVGVELTFFMATHVVLCFVSGAISVWITHHVLAVADQCLHSTKAFALPVLPPQQAG